MRRRVLALPLGALLILSISGVAPATGPRAVRGLESNCSAAAKSDHPIVFVHGLNGSTSVFDDIKKALKAKKVTGKDYYSDSDFCDWSWSSSSSLISLAKEFKYNTHALMPGKKFDVVTHSAGGPLTRYVLKYLEGNLVIKHWVSLAGPNHGVSGAHFCQFWGQIACRDLAKTGDFIEAINTGQAAPQPTLYMTWRTPCDETVGEWSVPVDGADNRVTNEPCSGKGGKGGAHNAIASAKDVITSVGNFLAPNSGNYRSRVDRVTMTKGDEQGKSGDDLWGDVVNNGTYVWSLARKNSLSNKHFPYNIPNINHGWVYTTNGQGAIYAHIIDDDDIGDDDLVEDTFYWDPTMATGSHTAKFTGEYGAAMITYTVEKANGARDVPADGRKVMLTAAHSSMVADVSKGGTAAGTPVIQYEPNFTKAQEWTMKAGPAPDTYRFMYGSLCMAESGGKIVTAACGSGRTEWKLHLTGGSDRLYHIVQAATGAVLSVPSGSTANWTQLITYPPGTNWGDQMWTVSTLDDRGKAGTWTVYDQAAAAYSTPVNQVDANYFNTTIRVGNPKIPQKMADWKFSFLLPEGFRAEGTDNGTLMEQKPGERRVDVYGGTLAIPSGGYAEFHLHGTGNNHQAPDLTACVLNTHPADCTAMESSLVSESPPVPEK
ncbi:ricin-type beta-trefoil lectin domain protein [Streptomyces sp. UMAF16]|nr:ricin-type beta-trefoil lectin domain protein [Streptomyces sp. UMAF16]